MSCRDEMGRGVFEFVERCDDGRRGPVSNAVTDLSFSPTSRYVSRIGLNQHCRGARFRGSCWLGIIRLSSTVRIPNPRHAASARRLRPLAGTVRANIWIHGDPLHPQDINSHPKKLGRRFGDIRGLGESQRDCGPTAVHHYQDVIQQQCTWAS
jgi:hypothetical protein